MELRTAWSMVKLAGSWRGGNSRNVWRKAVAIAVPYIAMKSWSRNQSQ